MPEVNDPWVVQPPKQTAQVPVGAYTAEFVGLEDFALPTSGEVKWKWRWLVKAGPEQGKEATALTDRVIRPTTLPGELISGLLGRPLVNGENIKAAVDACKGKHYMVVVRPGPKQGKPGVRVVSKPPQM
jgi:hypothetical protein